MKRVDDHIADILAVIDPLSALDLQLLDAHHGLLAHDVLAATDLPPFDNSAMDGYAVRAADLAGASAAEPLTLPVVDDIPAGSTSAHAVSAGMSARIMTGAPMPAGADAVVPVEWTDGGVAAVRVDQTPQPGQYVRRRGEDVQTGQLVLRAGSWLGATQIGLLAAIGRDRVAVRPRPRVVVLSTGSELVEPGTPTASGQISDSNSYTLTTAAREAGAVAYRVGIVPDDPRLLLDTIEDQLIRADLVVTSGGVSVGAYDVVKQVLSRLGTVTFDKVAMQPGMPQGFGTVGPEATPIFTLPGNPVSAYVSFEVFVRPAIRKMLGLDGLHRPVVRARCTAGFSSPPGRRQYARAWLSTAQDQHMVEPVGGHGSHLLGDLARSNCLIVVPEEVTQVPAGGTVDVMILDRRFG